MKPETIEPMDAELVGLLRRGAPSVNAPAPARQRVFGRLTAAIPALGFGAGGGHGPGGSSGYGPEGGSGVGPTLGRASANAGTTVLSAKVIGAVALSFVVGGGVGAVATRTTVHDQIRVVYVERPSPLAPTGAPPAALSVLDDSPMPPLAVSSHLPSPEPSTVGATSVGIPSRLNAERVLLDEARTAYSGGDLDACLRSLDKHRERYPGGILSEEREALTVRALANAGRTLEAQKRGSLFRSRYPRSLMLPAVEAAVENGPDSSQ